MKALLAAPGKGGVRMGNVPDPAPAPDEVKVRVLECGVCGVDQAFVAGRYGSPPAGRPDLVLGHENLGQVVEVGPAVRGLRVGDQVVATVRRGCGICRCCRTSRPDFCETGLFTERGIKGRDGYLAEFYVERSEHLVRVPRPHRLSAVVLVPLSAAEKAVGQARRVLDLSVGPTGGTGSGARTGLVAGTSAIGLLAALILASEGFEVTAVERAGEGSPARTLLTSIGVRYLNGTSGLSGLGTLRYDLILDAACSPRVDFELTSHLGPNGVLVVTGPPTDPSSEFPVRGGEILGRLMSQNQTILGSMTANRRYYELGLRHLTAFRRRWGTVAEQLVSQRLPWTEYAPVLTGTGPEGAKTVLTVGR